MCQGACIHVCRYNIEHVEAVILAKLLVESLLAVFVTGCVVHEASRSFLKKGTLHDFAIDTEALPFRLVGDRCH